MSDFILTQDQLAQILPGNPYIEHWYHALSEALPDYDITSPQRIACFLAQCAHESGGFTAIQENLNYKAESLCRVWPRYFNAGNADDYAHQPEKIANRAYAGRMGNGPEESGDGWKFCGRGLIQLTGRQNYQAFADSLQMSIDDVPEYLATFEGAVQSACFFWESNNLNQWADKSDMTTLTKKINGGTLGLEDRMNRYQHVLSILGA